MDVFELKKDKLLIPPSDVLGSALIIEKLYGKNNIKGSTLVSTNPNDKYAVSLLSAKQAHIHSKGKVALALEPKMKEEVLKIISILKKKSSK